jgi:hypothetical protein
MYYWRASATPGVVRSLEILTLCIFPTNNSVVGADRKLGVPQGLLQTTSTVQYGRRDDIQ